jgi:RNA polymerase-binding transcription factor DksA
VDPERARELLDAERKRIGEALAGRAPEPDDEPALTDAGDRASDTFTAELDEGLADDLREELAAVERAEQRLGDGTFD